MAGNGRKKRRIDAKQHEDVNSENDSADKENAVTHSTPLCVPEINGDKQNESSDPVQQNLNELFGVSYEESPSPKKTKPSPLRLRSKRGKK